MSQPESFTKEELKRDLRQRGITFPSNSTKDELVKLYRKKVSKVAKPRIEFSDEDVSHTHSPARRRKGTAQKKVSIDSYLPDIKTMSDEELIEELRDYGATPGPITNTTRLVYQKKLASFKAKGAVSVSHAPKSEEEEEVDYGDASDKDDLSSDDLLGEDSNDEDIIDVRVPLVAQYSQHRDRPVQVERQPEPPKLREDVLQRRPGPQSRDIRKSPSKPVRSQKPQHSAEASTTWCSCLGQTVAIILVLMLAVLLAVYLITGELSTKPLLEWVGQ
jgi:hypothetical protein